MSKSVGNVLPITPDEVVQTKVASMPDFVLEAFNLLISVRWNGHSAVVLQDEVVDEILRRGIPLVENLQRCDVFYNGWLNIEDLYRNSGWIVDYDKPGYTESYRPHFVFRRP